MQRRSRADWATVARERGDLAAVVAARRKELGLTQVALGDLAGVSYRVVHNLEAGRVEVSLERLLRSSRHWGCTWRLSAARDRAWSQDTPSATTTASKPAKVRGATHPTAVHPGVRKGRERIDARGRPARAQECRPG